MYEILAVNDESTDNSLEVMREYEKKYSEKEKQLSGSGTERCEQK